MQPNEVMEIDSDTVRLSEREQSATGLPSEFPLSDALEYAYGLEERYIPALCEAIADAQIEGVPLNQKEMVKSYHDHFCSSLVARGLRRATESRRP
jgi:hypothetical protein